MLGVCLFFMSSSPFLSPFFFYFLFFPSAGFFSSLLYYCKEKNTITNQIHRVHINTLFVELRFYCFQVSVPAGILQLFIELFDEMLGKCSTKVFDEMLGRCLGATFLLLFSSFLLFFLLCLVFLSCLVLT